jgi:hypothetical protein
MLWERLRNRRLCNYRFRRQSVVLGVIVDFWCPEVRLAIRVGPAEASDAILQGAGVGLIRIQKLSAIGVEPFIKGVGAELQMRRRMPDWGRHSAAITSDRPVPDA